MNKKKNNFHQPKNLFLPARMKDFVEIGVSAIRKMEKKMVSTSQKINCSFARMSCFIENYFLIIKVMLSNRNKIALTKKILFPLGRKFVVCTSRIKDIEKYVPMLKISEIIEKIGVNQHEYGSSLKIGFPQISVIFSISRKILGIKKILFPVDKKLASTCRNKDWQKNMFQLKEKLLPPAAVDCSQRKWKEMLSTSQKISFLQLKYGLSLKIGFH